MGTCLGVLYNRGRKHYYPLPGFLWLYLYFIIKCFMPYLYKEQEKDVPVVSSLN